MSALKIRLTIWALMVALTVSVCTSAAAASAAAPQAAAVRPSIAMVAPARVDAGRLLTITGAAVPARAGLSVQLWEQRGARWVAVADTVQSAAGTFVIGIRAGTVGAHTYRVVTEGTVRGRFDVRGRARVVTTVPASGLRATYLADVTPLGGLVGRSDEGALYATGTYPIAGRLYPKSVHTASGRFSYEMGADAVSFGTALALLPVQRALLCKGPRLFEVRLDGVLKIRRYIKDGQAVPLTLDVRGKRVVTISSYDSGPLDFEPGSDVLLATPVVTTAARAVRGVDPGVALSELRPTSVTGSLLMNEVVGSSYTTLLGGSLLLEGDLNSDVGPGGKSVTGHADFALAGAYRRLTGVPGLSGEPTGGVTGTVRIYGDGVVLADLSEDVWGSDPATVDVTGVRRLRVELVAAMPINDQVYPWFVTFADPRLT